jgi:ABC-type nitrate/sulfonate/bicarbonate transport system substrate-binding protein
VGSVGVIVLLAGIVAVGVAQPKMQVIGFAMPTTPPNLVHIPVWVAQETGLFAKYGIDAKIFTFEGGPSALRALIGGGGQIAVAAPGIPPFVSALAQGSELKAIGSYAVRHPVAMVAQAEIKQCADLRGKKIGTPGGAGAYPEVMTRGMLQSCGLTPRDVQYINIATGARVPALATNQVDAMVLHVDQVYEAAKTKPTLHILAHLSQVLPKGWYAAYVATGDQIRSNPQSLQNVVLALVEANRFLYQNRDRTIEIGVKYTKFSRDVVEKTYDDLARIGIWPVNEGLTPDLVTAGIETEVQLGTITADIKPTYEQAVQWGFLRAAITKLGRWTGDPRW